MNASRQQARLSYDRLSGWYDLISASENPFKDRALELLALCPGERLLEIGSGTGRTLVHAAGRLGAAGLAGADGLAGAEGLAVGIDLSPGMAAVARKKLAWGSLAGRAALVTGDAAALPFDAASFDAIFCAFTLELFEEEEFPRVLSECRRMLRSGGRMALVSLARPQKPGPAVRVYDWFHNRFPSVVDCRPIPAAMILDENGFRMRSVEHAKMWGLPLEIIVCG